MVRGPVNLARAQAAALATWFAESFETTLSFFDSFAFFLACGGRCLEERYTEGTLHEKKVRV